MGDLGTRSPPVAEMLGTDPTQFLSQPQPELPTAEADGVLDGVPAKELGAAAEAGEPLPALGMKILDGEVPYNKWEGEGVGGVAVGGFGWGYNELGGLCEEDLQRYLLYCGTLCRVLGGTRHLEVGCCKERVQKIPRRPQSAVDARAPA